MSKAKYVLEPGLVRSQKDGQEHWISPGQLMRLYKVPASECVVFDWKKAHSNPEYLEKNKDMLKLIRLAPRYDGEYPIFEEPKTVWPFPTVFGKVPE